MNKDVFELKIKKLGILKKYSKGEYLFNASERADFFYYIVSGEVRIYKLDEEGNELEISRFKEGDFLGEVVAFASDVYPVYAEVFKDVKVLRYTKEKMFSAIKKDSNIAEYFINLFARKCLIMNKKLEYFTLSTVRQRLIQFLLSLCKGDGKCEVTLPFTKTELSKKLGTISATLSRTLQKLKEEGLIEVEKNVIKVKDLKKLKEGLR